MGLPVKFSPYSKWGKTFFREVAEIASRSKDPSKKVGCIIVRPDKTVASQGYNGLPSCVPDVPEILENKTFKLAATLHAEENAVLNAREYDMTGYIAYVYPMHVCSHCCSVLAQRGIRHIVCVDGPSTGWEADKKYAKRLAQLAGISITTISVEEFEKLTGHSASSTFPLVRPSSVERVKQILYGRFRPST